MSINQTDLRKAKILSLVVLLCMSVASGLVYAGKIGLWDSLKDDGLHDRRNKKGLKVLQEPGEALSKLPRGVSGNKVDWVMALQKGFIEPRTHIYEGTEIRVIDLDIIMGETSTMNYVMFPHKAHTEWLDCKNCHPIFFEPKVGVTPVNMGAILEGEFCGRCHGAVSFPLTDCNRCHSIIQGTFTGTFGAQYPPGTQYEDYSLE